MKDVILLLPFNQSVKHLRVLCDRVQQLFIACIGTDPAAVSPAVSVDRGKQPVILTELVGVRQLLSCQNKLYAFMITHFVEFCRERIFF